MLLEAECLVKRYARPTAQRSHFEAVCDVSLALSGGTLTEVTGRSGSGKSTLLCMMAGLLTPTSGTVRLDGSDLYAMGDDALSRLRNRSFGMMLQGQTGLYALTVRDNITAPAMLYGDSHDAESHAQELMERLGIAHLAGSRIQELSGGELRRLSVARALVMRPQVVFADEPTDDLDDDNTRLVLAMLREYADSGAAVLLVTHEPEAARYADALYRMDAGHLVIG